MIFKHNAYYIIFYWEKKIDEMFLNFKKIII